GALLLQLRDERPGVGVEALRQLAARTTHQLAGRVGMPLGIGVEQLVPLVLAHGAGVVRAPGGADPVRNLERAVLPAERLARGRDLVLAQRRAMRGLLAGLVRRAVADGGAAAQQRRPVLRAQRLLDRGLDALRIV